MDRDRVDTAVVAAGAASRVDMTRVVTEVDTMRVAGTRVVAAGAAKVVAAAGVDSKVYFLEELHCAS